MNQTFFFVRSKEDRGAGGVGVVQDADMEGGTGRGEVAMGEHGNWERGDRGEENFFRIIFFPKLLD